MITSGLGLGVVGALVGGGPDTFQRSNIDVFGRFDAPEEETFVELEEGVPGKDLGFLAVGAISSLSPAASNLLLFLFFSSSGGDLILTYWPPQSR